MFFEFAQAAQLLKGNKFVSSHDVAMMLHAIVRMDLGFNDDRVLQPAESVLLDLLYKRATLVASDFTPQVCRCVCVCVCVCMCVCLYGHT